MMHLTVRDSGTLGILTLRGHFSELHAEELRANLTRGLNRPNRLIVNCERVASLDITCLKLLCSAYRLSHILKKDFVLAGDRAALFQRAAGADADARCPGTVLGCETGCLWTDGAACRTFETGESGSAREQDNTAA